MRSDRRNLVFLAYGVILSFMGLYILLVHQQKSVYIRNGGLAALIFGILICIVSGILIGRERKRNIPSDPLFIDYFLSENKYWCHKKKNYVNPESKLMELNICLGQLLGHAFRKLYEFVPRALGKF